MSKVIAFQRLTLWQRIKQRFARTPVAEPIPKRQTDPVRDAYYDPKQFRRQK